MATGDKTDMLSRLTALMPTGWFPDSYATIRDAVLEGAAQGLTFVYSLLDAVRAQTRISTATGGVLDMIAGDFFGDSGLPRTAGQTDASYRARIIANILRERGTRNSIVQVLKQLTGRTPEIFEPQRPMDTGGYGAAYGYGTGGGYGSLLLPIQTFVTAYRPSGGGVASLAPYNLAGGDTGGGYGVGSAAYAAIADAQGQVSDADIYAAINSVRPAGYTIWARIGN